MTQEFRPKTDCSGTIRQLTALGTVVIVGIVPVSLLRWTAYCSRLGRLLTGEATVPSNWFLSRATIFRFIIPLKSGTDPVNWLLVKINVASESIWVSEVWNLARQLIIFRH